MACRQHGGVECERDAGPPRQVAQFLSLEAISDLLAVTTGMYRARAARSRMRAARHPSPDHDVQPLFAEAGGLEEIDPCRGRGFAGRDQRTRDSQPQAGAG